MFNPFGAVLIVLGLLDGLVCWFLLLPKVKPAQRPLVLGATVASTAVLVGLGVAVGWGYIEM